MFPRFTTRTIIEKLGIRLDKGKSEVSFQEKVEKENLQEETEYFSFASWDLTKQ